MIHCNFKIISRCYHISNHCWLASENDWLFLLFQRINSWWALGSSTHFHKSILSNNSCQSSSLKRSFCIITWSL